MTAFDTDDCEAVVASIRLGVWFGPGLGKRFLNVEYPFDGTPEDFDRAWEQLRVRYHEKASASERPCGFGGPWATTASQSSVSKAETVWVGRDPITEDVQVFTSFDAAENKGWGHRELQEVPIVRA